MAKGKKRKWWIIPVVIGVLLLLALASPFALLKYVNTPAGASNISQIASSYLKADVRVEKIQLNILKTKPNLCIVIENADVFSHVFVEDNSDTLLHFDHLSLSVNYMKYLKEGKVLVNYLDLEHPKVSVRVDSLGKANYQIYESKDTTPSNFTLPEIFLTNLGQNAKINRKLNQNDISVIFQSLVDTKKAMFVNQKHPSDIYILWKSLNEWEQYLYNAAMNRQSIDKLETLDYIIEDDDNKNEEYFNMDKNMLIDILKSLEKKGKCGLVKDGDNYIAVKFIR